MWNFQDLTGQRFGRLTVLKRTDDYISPSGNRLVQWLCRCDCGSEKITTSASLKRGTAQSCGCLHKEKWYSIITKHGKADSRLYRVWKGIITRCCNNTNHAYEHYGARGITVCSEWKNDFQVFYDWAMANGYSDNLTIDRIDNNGDYTPKNCRWVTFTTQANNKRNNHYLTCNGKTMTMAEWAREIGIPYYVLQGRINQLNWSVEEALNRNKRPRRRV
jgi:hypothetical protein